MDEENIEEKEVIETEKVQEEKSIETVENVSGEGIRIANDVIAAIANKAASEVSGVFSMAGGISDVFGKKMSRGIKVDAWEKNTKIDVNIIVEYGARIPDVAFEIQNRVKKAVESMTGLEVLEVNVHVQGVNLPDEDVKN